MKKLMKVFFILVLVFLVSIPLIAGGKQETAEAGEISLDLWFQDWSGGKKWQEEFISFFQDENPGIKVNLILLPWAELNAKLIPAISQGNEADIMYGYSGWINNIDNSKLFLRLSPDIYSKSKFEELIYKPALKSSLGSDGEVYTVPIATGGNGFGFIIHQDLADEAGIDTEEIDSWEKLKNAAKKLTTYNDDGSIKRNGLVFMGNDAGHLFVEMIMQQGASNKLYNNDTNTWNFNIPEAVNAMELIKSVVDEKIYDPFSGDVMQLFPNKLSALIMVGPWATGTFQTDYPGLDLKYITVPVYPGGTRKHLQQHWGSFMLSKRLEGDRKDAALLFLKTAIENPEFIDIPYERQYYAGISPFISYKNYVKTRMEEGKEVNYYQKLALQLMDSILPTVDPIPFKTDHIPLCRDIIWGEMQKVLKGDQSIDEMLNYLTDHVNNLEREK